ncbi:MAG: hypothetical protein J2P49_05165 [Methylocapsa sp.]|nr:hypothetical protein [Methylocapsa sp.]
MPKIPVPMTVAEFLAWMPTIGAELLRRAGGGSWPAEPMAVETRELVPVSIGFSMLLVAACRTTRLAPNE